MRRLLVAGSALFLASTAAQAQIRYIASTGNDSGNNCASAKTPCRTLPRGIAATPAGGELRILDSGAYGNGGLVNKSMTISADGETVMLNGTLTIDAAGAAVTLRGLSLNGHSVATGAGIHIASAAAVHIDGCTVERFGGTGIESVGNGTRLFVNDSVSRQNHGYGLLIKGSGARLIADNSRFERNGIGIFGEGAGGSVTRTVVSSNSHGIYWRWGQLNIAWSVAADNVNSGFVVTGGGGARMYLESSVARGNAVGLWVEGGSLASISNFTATENGQSGMQITGTVYTRQNNTFVGNATHVRGTPPVPLPPF
jgi:hypothetical protein